MDYAYEVRCFHLLPGKCLRGYGVSNREVMVAAAPGEVFKISTLNTGRAGGEMVTVTHGYGQYKSYYAHLIDT